jgi:hypothetical protein
MNYPALILSAAFDKVALRQHDFCGWRSLLVQVDQEVSQTIARSDRKPLPSHIAVLDQSVAIARSDEEHKGVTLSSG